MAHLTSLFLPITAKLGATATGETESDDFTLESEKASTTTTTTTTPAKGPDCPRPPLLLFLFVLDRSTRHADA